MHRDRIRFLIKKHQHTTIEGAEEIARGLHSVLAQLDAAAKYLKSETADNRAALEKLLNEH